MKFKIGDLAVTQRSRAPLLNDGHTVVVLFAFGEGSLGWVEDFARYYYIERIDGQPFGMTHSFVDDRKYFFTSTTTWVEEQYLRRIDESAPDDAMRIAKGVPA